MKTKSNLITFLVVGITVLFAACTSPFNTNFDPNKGMIEPPPPGYIDPGLSVFLLEAQKSDGTLEFLSGGEVTINDEYTRPDGTQRVGTLKATVDLSRIAEYGAELIRFVPRFKSDEEAALIGDIRLYGPFHPTGQAPTIYPSAEMYGDFYQALLNIMPTGKGSNPGVVQAEMQRAFGVSSNDVPSRTNIVETIQDEFLKLQFNLNMNRYVPGGNPGGAEEVALANGSKNPMTIPLVDMTDGGTLPAGAIASNRSGIYNYIVYSVSSSGYVMQYELTINVQTTAPHHVKAGDLLNPAWEDSIEFSSLTTPLISGAEYWIQADYATTPTRLGHPTDLTEISGGLSLIGGFTGSETAVSGRPNPITATSLGDIAGYRGLRTTIEFSTAIDLLSDALTLQDIDVTFPAGITIEDSAALLIKNAQITGDITINAGGRLVIEDSKIGASIYGTRSKITGTITNNGGSIEIRHGVIAGTVTLGNGATMSMADGTTALDTTTSLIKPASSAATDTTGVQIGYYDTSSPPVFYGKNALFSMIGGEISGFTKANDGIAVAVTGGDMSNYGKFRMTGGIIKDNGIGVKIIDSGVFSKTGTAGLSTSNTITIGIGGVGGIGYTIVDGTLEGTATPPLPETPTSSPADGLRWRSTVSTDTVFETTEPPPVNKSVFSDTAETRSTLKVIPLLIEPTVPSTTTVVFTGSVGTQLKSIASGGSPSVGDYFVFYGPNNIPFQNATGTLWESGRIVLEFASSYPAREVDTTREPNIIIARGSKLRYNDGGTPSSQIVPLDMPISGSVASPLTISGELSGNNALGIQLTDTDSEWTGLEELQSYITAGQATNDLSKLFVIDPQGLGGSGVNPTLQAATNTPVVLQLVDSSSLSGGPFATLYDARGRANDTVIITGLQSLAGTTTQNIAINPAALKARGTSPTVAVTSFINNDVIVVPAATTTGQRDMTIVLTDGTFNAPVGPVTISDYFYFFGNNASAFEAATSADIMANNRIAIHFSAATPSAEAQNGIIIKSTRVSKTGANAISGAALSEIGTATIGSMAINDDTITVTLDTDSAFVPASELNSTSIADKTRFFTLGPKTNSVGFDLDPINSPSIEFESGATANVIVIKKIAPLIKASSVANAETQELTVNSLALVKRGASPSVTALRSNSSHDIVVTGVTTLGQTDLSVVLTNAKFTAGFNFTSAQILTNFSFLGPNKTAFEKATLAAVKTDDSGLRNRIIFSFNTTNPVVADTDNIIIIKGSGSIFRHDDETNFTGAGAVIESPSASGGDAITNAAGSGVPTYHDDTITIKLDTGAFAQEILGSSLTDFAKLFTVSGTGFAADANGVLTSAISGNAPTLTLSQTTNPNDTLTITDLTPVVLATGASFTQTIYINTIALASTPTFIATAPIVGSNSSKDAKAVGASGTGFSTTSGMTSLVVTLPTSVTFSGGSNTTIPTSPTAAGVGFEFVGPNKARFEGSTATISGTNRLVFNAFPSALGPLATATDNMIFIKRAKVLPSNPIGDDATVTVLTALTATAIPTTTAVQDDTIEVTLGSGGVFSPDIARTGITASDLNDLFTITGTGYATDGSGYLVPLSATFEITLNTIGTPNTIAKIKGLKPFTGDVSMTQKVTVNPLALAEQTATTTVTVASTNSTGDAKLLNFTTVSSMTELPIIFTGSETFIASTIPITINRFGGSTPSLNEFFTFSGPNKSIFEASTTTAYITDNKRIVFMFSGTNLPGDSTTDKIFIKRGKFNGTDGSTNTQALTKMGSTTGYITNMALNHDAVTVTLTNATFAPEIFAPRVAPFDDDTKLFTLGPGSTSSGYDPALTGVIIEQLNASSLIIKGLNTVQAVNASQYFILNPLALATKSTTLTPSITVTSGGGASSSPVLSPGSYGTVTAGATLIAMPAATTSSKYVVRSNGRWYSVAALSAAGAALTVEPSLGDAIKNTTVNSTVTAGHGITGVAGTQYDIYAVYETPILSSGTPTIELKTTTKNSIINVSNLTLNSTNAALEYKITSTNNPDSTVQILLYTGGDSVASLPTIPNYKNTTAVAPAALSTDFTKFGNDWWAFKIDKTYSQSGIAQYPYLTAQPGDDYATLSRFDQVGSRLVLHITRGLILLEGSHGKADIDPATGYGKVTGLTAISSTDNGTNASRERHGYVIKNVTGGSTIAWGTVHAGAYNASAGALEGAFAFNDTDSNHMPAGSSAPYTITGISSADNDKDFSVYEITQYDNSIGTGSDGTVSLNDGLNHAVYLKGLTPGQTGTVAKTGLYGVKLAKTEVPANSGAVEVVIATGAIMTGVTQISTTGQFFGTTALAPNTDLEYQAIGTIATTGIVFNDTRYNGTTTAASAGSLRFGVGGTTTNPDKFLYIQIPKTISSFHTSVVPAPEEVLTGTTPAVIVAANKKLTVTLSTPSTPAGNAGYFRQAETSSNFSYLTNLTAETYSFFPATLFKLSSTSGSTLVVGTTGTPVVGVAGTAAVPMYKIAAAALKRKISAFTVTSGTF